MDSRSLLPELHEIKARYFEWEVIGPPEIRDVSTSTHYFTPHKRDVSSGIGNLGPLRSHAGSRSGA